jgi:hypothetical protein
MEQLKNYLTHQLTCVQLLMKTNNGVVCYHAPSDLIFIDGSWWTNFTTNNSISECKKLLQYLHRRFETDIRILFDNTSPICFTWNDEAKMYLCKNGGYYQTDKQL